MRLDQNIDHAIVPGHGPDAWLAQKIQLPQIAFRFLEQTALVRLARPEQQRGLDGAGVRVQMQSIGEAIQSVVFVRILLIEDLRVVDGDGSDPCARRFERCIVRQRLRCRRYRRRTQAWSLPWPRPWPRALGEQAP